MTMLQDVLQYLADHPVILAAIGVFIVLAIIGAWYVLSHHLGVLLVTMLCAAGFASGGLVLYRGYMADMRDLMGVGAFLLVTFALIYREAVRVARIAYGHNPAAMSKGHAKRAGA